MRAVARQQRESLKRLDERYRLAITATNDLFWDWDLVTDEIEWIGAPESRLGYRGQQLGATGNWWATRIHPQDVERVKADLSLFLAGSIDRFECEYRFMRADGTYAPIYDRGYIMRNSAHQPVRMVGAMQDNSERAAVLSQIEEQRSQLSTVFGQATVGIMQRHEDGQLIMVNDRFCEILGRTEEELSSLRFEDFTHPDDLNENQELFEKARIAGTGFRMEKRYLRPDGTVIWCEVSVSFARNAAGEIQSSIVIAQDINSRKVAEATLAEQSSLIQNVIDSVADFIFVKDAAGKFILANRAFTTSCGEMLGRTADDLVVAGTTSAHHETDHEVIETGQLRLVNEVIAIGGDRRTFETVKVPWICEGKTQGVIGVSRDITEQKAAEEALRQSELLYRSVLETSADSIKIIDLDGRIRLMNAPGQRALNLLNFEQVRGVKWIDLWSRESKPALKAALSEALQGRVARFTGCCPTMNRIRKWWDVVLTPMCNDNGEVANVLAISRDVSAQKHADEQLRWASEHDELTGLPNRRAFQHRLQAATLRAMENAASVGLLLIDLDHFKHVNDALGHSAGDHLLKHFAKRLRESIKPGDFIARLGGDEFAVITENNVGQCELVQTGNAILENLRKSLRYNGRLIRTAASIGGATFPCDAETAHELFNNADTALYSLKSAGRGGLKMYHPLMGKEAQRAASQLILARSSINERSVEPHYQPKVDLETGRTVGFEALLRWRHPSFGMQLPGSVSEAFEDYELSTKIGELVQRRVYADMAAWTRAGLQFGTIAINASPAEFLRDDYAERLLHRISDFAVDPRKIEIEVTEHALLDRGGRYVARALETLSSAGVRIALDDFGTGHSSLSHLRDFPVHVLKVDQSFIQRMLDDPEIQSIVAAVIGLSCNLNIEVVAEGIEKTSQRDLLLNYGCSLGQGHLFGRAIDRASVERQLSSVAPATELLHCQRVTGRAIQSGTQQAAA